MTIGDINKIAGMIPPRLLILANTAETLRMNIKLTIIAITSVKTFGCVKNCSKMEVKLKSVSTLDLCITLKNVTPFGSKTL